MGYDGLAWIALLLALTCQAVAATDPFATRVDLSAPGYDPPDCPAWARVTVPNWVQPYLGVNGVPEKWRPGGKPMGSSVRGVDRYQANHFVYHRPETAAYLYGDYTAPTVSYSAGTLPSYEKLATQHSAGCTGATQKAVALLKAMPRFFRHPGMPPLGPSVKPDRNLDDEALLATGCGWCNEQARVFIRLCQVSGISARMVHLFGQNHTVAEFYADSRWALADATYGFVTRGPDGYLLSAAQCHDRGAGQRAYAEAKQQRIQELVAMSDEELGFKDPEAARAWRERSRQPIVDELSVREIGFGIMNCPLPR